MNILKLTENIRQHTYLRRVVILSWHVIGTCLAYYLAFFLRFEGHISPAEALLFWRTLPFLISINLIVFATFRLYSGMWAFFSLADLLRILGALITGTLIFVITVFLLLDRSFFGYPRSVFIVYLLIMGGWMTGARLVARWVREHFSDHEQITDKLAQKRILLVGSLQDSEQVLRGLSGQEGRVVGIVTDDADARHLTIRGIKIFAPVSIIGQVARRNDANSILILPPYTRPKQIDKVVDHCEKEGVSCTFQMIPSLPELASGRIELSSIRRVELEDLLGRPEISFKRQSVREMLSGKAVMITGAGGSIGSELARQVANYSPAMLILLDISEFNLYSIDLELRKKIPTVPMVFVAGDIGHAEHVRRVCRQYKVQVIYHAAAYKHVPMMEINAGACVLNNTIGTAVLAEEAENCGVERFVLISSDKAVRPTSVMGASKRLAERVTLERKKSSMCSVAVRFGNVLGSSGSVIPLFRRQIEEGGPVTVTSPTITRYFMSIPEAVDLVLQASVVGEDRDVMILEMGEQIKIADMAKRLIELSGLRVGEDIDIVFTGIRPGEKEYEELTTNDENVVRTPFEKIWVMRRKEDEKLPVMDLNRLTDLAQSGNDTELRRELLRLIPDAYLSLAPRKESL